jgi:RNA polymerase sigma factor (sigma-70 family)
VPRFALGVRVPLAALGDWNNPVALIHVRSVALQLCNEQVEDLLNLAVWQVRRYKGHEDWEDIEQVARIAAWEMIDSGKEIPTCKLTTLICNQAEWQVRDFFRTPQATHRVYRYRKEQPPRPLSYDAPRLNTKGEEMDTDGRWLQCPDFSDEVIDRISLWEELDALCPPRYQKILRLRFVEDLLLTEIAAMEGVHASRIYGIITDALDRYREKYNLPTKGQKRRKRVAT